MATSKKTDTKTTTPEQVTEKVAVDIETQGAQNADGSAQEAAPGNASNPLNAAVPHAFTPKVAKILTLPLLKMKEGGEPVYVKFTGPMFVGKKIKEDIDAEKAGKPSKEPPIMANVINLPTGELVQIMLGKVLKGILEEDYPEGAYVGKGFMIQLVEKKRGRGAGEYNTYKVAELDLS